MLNNFILKCSNFLRIGILKYNLFFLNRNIYNLQKIQFFITKLKYENYKINAT
jgi:hypothetical protein